LRETLADFLARVTQAIELDPSAAVHYNNRAAAYLAMGEVSYPFHRYAPSHCTNVLLQNNAAKAYDDSVKALTVATPGELARLRALERCEKTSNLMLRVSHLPV
jgi:hypothetical protein